MISIYLALLFALLTNASTNNVYSTARIYSNQAEIIQPLSKLPLEFTEDEWNFIRSDSITLIGENVHVSTKTITEKRKTLNGNEIYVRSPVSSDKTSVKLIKATLIDEYNNLIKIQDPTIADRQTLYFTVSRDQMFFIEEPTKTKYSVNFTYTNVGSNVFVSYLQSNLNWRTQYQLNIRNDESELIVMANIRNDGKSSVSFDRAELIGGDFNLQIQRQLPRSFRRSRLNSDINIQQQAAPMQMLFSDSPELIEEPVQELFGLYIFSITKPLTVDGKTNYLLSMHRPHVSIERYSLISKLFSTISNTGKAQRSYHLKSDRYLSEGNCIIREQDRIVGEVKLPNLAANNQYDFSIGEDADVVYKENIALLSMTTFNETESVVTVALDKASSPTIIITRTAYIYKIKLEIKNFKTTLINVEYEQKGFLSYQKVQLKKSDEHKFIQDGSTIKSNMTIHGNTTEIYSYTVELIR